jgi:hypothetical protein
MAKVDKERMIGMVRSLKTKRDSIVGNYQLPDEITWDSFTPESIEVLQFFGMDAPTKLNEYACAVEDAFLELVNGMGKLKKENDRLKAELSIRKATENK